MNAPDTGGDDRQPPREPPVNRDEVPSLMDRCGFKWWCWPSYPNVLALARELGGTDPRSEDERRADELLQDLERNHVGFDRSLQDQGGRGAFTDEERQAPNGPYRALARILAEFLAAWVRANVFGEELTELTGLVVAEHHLAMQAFTVTLGYPRVDTGAVVYWLRRLRNGDDVLHNLENAILGRFRRQA